jgi:hypothetical protein
MREVAASVAGSRPDERPGAGWIVSPRFDLLWFFGGAALSLLVLGVYFAGVPIVLLWWVWLIGFDGPHIAAAFTRTYADPLEWRTRPRVLGTGLLALLAGPVFLAANAATGSEWPFLLFLALATFYGYYHVVRQHYGFFALYSAVGRGTDRRSIRIDRWCLYVGCWAPYFYFLFTNPKAREILRLAPAGSGSRIEALLVQLAAIAWLVAVATFAIRSLRTARRGVEVQLPRLLYFFVTVLLYGAIYFFVARMEPVYSGSRGPDEDFLLLSILIVVFHNVQYLGLVWFHNRNRYRRGGREFGVAGWLNQSPGRYLAACAAFSLVVYLGSAAATGVFPRLLGSGPPGAVRPSQIGLCLWWGIAINHYYLDQKIWRIRGDSALKQNLGLA